ncbi:MAG: hypothetical protein WD013_02075 [Gemmatimonadota bacterium]
MGRSIGVIFVLLSAALLPQAAEAQGVGASVGAQQAQDSGFYLGRNFPNPFNSETRIPFDLYEEAFPEGRPATATIRIYNILRQYVASPTAMGHPGGDGVEIVNLEYSAPGHYEAHWDGRDRSGSYVASGVYIVELTVNGRSQVRRMFVSD